MILPDLLGIDVGRFWRMRIGNGEVEGTIRGLFDLDVVDNRVAILDLVAVHILRAIDNFLHGVHVRLHFRRFAFSPVVLVQTRPGVGPAVGRSQLHRFGNRNGIFTRFSLVQLHTDSRPLAVLVVRVVPDLRHGDFGLRRVLVRERPGASSFILRRRSGGLLVILIQLNAHEFLDRIDNWFGHHCLRCVAFIIRHGLFDQLVLGQIFEGICPVVRFCQIFLLHGLGLIVANFGIQDRSNLLRTFVLFVGEVVPDLCHRYFDRVGRVSVDDGETIHSDGVLSAVEGHLVVGQSRAIGINLGHLIDNRFLFVVLLVQLSPGVCPVVSFLQLNDQIITS